MAKYIFLLFSCFLTFYHNNPAEKEVKKAFVSFYHVYQQNHHNHRKIPRNFLSKDLLFFIDLAQKKEKQSTENIRRSNSPTEKPDIIEGDVFSSLYEGFNEHKILTCTIKNNTARLKLELKNTNFKPVLVWNDDCILINENGIWKIDNFIFRKKGTSFKDTKEIFKSFMHFERPPIK